MLADIRDYLRRRDTVNLRDLAVHFDMEPDARAGGQYTHLAPVLCSPKSSRGQYGNEYGSSAEFVGKCAVILVEKRRNGKL